MTIGEISAIIFIGLGSFITVVTKDKKWIIIFVLVSIAGLIFDKLFDGQSGKKDKTEIIDSVSGSKSEILESQMHLKEEIIKVVESGKNGTNKYQEEEKFFRERDFSILNTIFPNGYEIIRQNNEGEPFKKSIFKSNKLHSNLKSTIIFNNDIAYIAFSGSIATTNGNVMESGIMTGQIICLDHRCFLKLQPTGGPRANNLCQFLVVTDKDIDGFTYALGYLPCAISPNTPTGIGFDNLP